MDKRLIAERFAKAIGTYPHEARVQQQIARKMTALLQQYVPRRSCRRVVEFGCGTGTYSRLLVQSLHPERLLLNDLCPGMKACCHDLLNGTSLSANGQVTFFAGDAETMHLPAETDLITSCSALQWFEAPDAFFGRCSEALARHGYLAFSTFGPENMKEIRHLTGNGLAYRTKAELETALSPLFHIVHAEEAILPLTFDTPMQVLYHLKQTGVTATANRAWTRSELSLFCHEYERLFGTDRDSVPLTYHPIYIIAKKKEQA